MSLVIVNLIGLKTLTILVITMMVNAAIVQNLESLHLQIESREHKSSLIDSIYQNLSLEDHDFVDSTLLNLTNFRGNRCESCHNKIKYAQYLLQKYPTKDHLISLTLYKYCLEQNKGKDSKCEFVDFFLFTAQREKAESDARNQAMAGLEGETSVNFFFNDFTEMVRNFNTSSKLSLDYYCHYKGKYCELPTTPPLETIFNLTSFWPEKTPEKKIEPKYNTTRESFNVLHLSDFHNQLRFQIGAEANCSQGLCCLPESYNQDLIPKGYNFTDVYQHAGANMSNVKLSFYPDAEFSPIDDTYFEGKYHDMPAFRGWNWAWEPATTFGNYQCDPPEVMLNHSLKHISLTFDNNKYEFSVFTGDIVDHDVAHCDPDTTRYAETRSYKIMRHFLHQQPVYPTLGNHDTFPCGQLAPERLNNKTFNESLYHWNDDLISDLWISNGWIDSSLKSFIRQHYSSYTTTTDRGLKIISLNSNCYYKKNLYAYINMEAEPDLFGQWEFLINELIESENSNQRVWILAHIPAGDADALPIQSEIFAGIVKRFSPFTIAGIFYGHTHRDQVKVLYEDNAPVNMAWISQAITPLGPANPSWRYYRVEDESFNILESYNYYSPLNATWTNGGEEPIWSYGYSARDTYDPNHEWPALAPLNASFWDKFVVQKLKDRHNIQFNQRYTDLMFRENPYVPDCKNGSQVTDKCYQNNYCDAIGFKIDDFNECIS